MARQTSSALAAIDRHSEIAVAKAQAVADVPQAGVEAVARTRAYAMQQTALVSNMQQQLSMSALAASGDLDYIKTVTVMGNDSRRHRHHTTRRAAVMSRHHLSDPACVHHRPERQLAHGAAQPAELAGASRDPAPSRDCPYPLGGGSAPGRSPHERHHSRRARAYG